MEKVPPIESVEASKAARLQRHQARYRDRGGIFKPPESNALLDILLSRNVNGESPSRPRPGPRKSKTPTAQRARARASIAPAPASRKKAARVPRKSVRKPAGRNDEDAAAQDRPRAKKAKARAKTKSVPDNDNDPQMQRSYAAQLADVINAGRPVPPKSKPRSKKKQPTPQPADTNATTETSKRSQPRSAPSPASDDVFPIEPPKDVDLSNIDTVRLIVHRSPHKDFEPVLMSCTVDEIDPPSDLEPPKLKRGRPKKAAAASTARAKKPLSKTNMRLGEKSSGQSKPSSSKAPLRATAPEPEPEPKPPKGKGKETAVPRSLSPILEEGEEEPDVSQSVDVPLVKAVKGKRKADEEVGRGTKKRRQEEPLDEADEVEAVVPARETTRMMVKAGHEEEIEEEEAAVPAKKSKVKAATKTTEKPAKASSSRLEDDFDGRKPVKKGSRARKAQPLKVQEEDPPDDDDDVPLAELPKKAKAKQGAQTKAQQKEEQPDEEDDVRAAEASKKVKGKAKEKQRQAAPDSDAERPGKRARDEAADDLKRGNKKSRVVIREDDEEEEGPATPIKPNKARPGPKSDVFSRVAKEATSVPAVKPIPSPIKKKPPSGKPPSKPIVKTRKPQSQRATTKPPSRGPPPSVLRLLAANAARSQMQANEASDDDPIDFLGGAE